MTVEQSDVIDFIGEDPDGAISLHMVEVRPLDGSRAQLEQIQTKVNTYLGYLLDGQFAEQYPAMVGRPLKLVLDHFGDLDPVTGEFLQRLEPALSEYSIAFTTHRVGPLDNLEG